MTNARFLWAWILGLFILAVGCSGDSHVGESEPLGKARQALSSEQERVLEFESPADWTTSAGTLSAASVVAQGSGALAVQRPQAWTEVCSKPLSSLGSVGSSLTVALWQQATPTFGTVQLFVRIPSLGHHDTPIQPPIPLHDKAAGVFHTLTFPLGTTASALSGTYSDLRLCFVINASAGLYVLDDARFSGLTTASSSSTTSSSSSTTGSGGTSGAGGTSGSGGAAESTSDTSSTTGSGAESGSGGTAGTGGGGDLSQCIPETSTWDRLVLRFPRGISLRDIPLSAQGGTLDIHDGVAVRTGNGSGFASVSTLGNAADLTELGANAETGHVYSVPPVYLRSNAVVHGFVKSGGGVTQQTGAQVEQARLEDFDHEPFEVIEIPYRFPDEPNPVPGVITNGSTITLSPGGYGNVSVQAQSRLKLSAGTYTFESLNLEPGTFLDLDNAAGAISVFSRGSFRLKVAPAYTAPNKYNVLFAVTGSGPIELEKNFRGTLIAPNADVTLPTATIALGHHGSVHARNLTVHQHTDFLHHPYQRDAADCASVDPEGLGGIFGCPAHDSDGDGFSDCFEANDDSAFTDPESFNGFEVTLSDMCHPGQDLLVEHIDTREEVQDCLDNATNKESAPSSGGWSWPAPGGDTICSIDYGFGVAWTDCRDRGLIHVAGIFEVTEEQRQCFRVIDGSASLGTNSAISALLLPGYVREAPITAADGVACVELPLGIHRIEWIYEFLEKSDHGFEVSACFSADGDCIPPHPSDLVDQLIDNPGMSLPLLPCHEGECKLQCPCEPADECEDDADCPTGEVCGENNGGAVGQEPGSSVCWPSVCETEDWINNCGNLEMPCGYCEAPGCKSTLDCPEDFSCGNNNGSYFDLPGDVDVCWPIVCEVAREINCGPDSACGACTPQSPEPCEPNCADATCGSLTRDGCGGFCRTCAGGEPGCEGDAECPEGYVCGLENGDRFGFPGENVCWRKPCGDEGAACGDGSECGDCPPCEPSCNESAPCGDDGCGSSCGECPSPLECRNGSCTNVFLPSPPLPEGVDPTDYETQDVQLGSMLGNHRIALDGQVAYSIPLRLPPGQNGLTPELALEYHGSRGNGLLGSGWAMKGFSEITRCERTVSHDGAAEPLLFTDRDRFCVDGRRLENISGDYGADGSIYRSEFDDITKYAFERPHESGLGTWFRAYGKDGLIRRYGLTNSVDQPFSDVRTRWYIDEVEDRHGNSINYSFAGLNISLDDEQRRLPSSISYGGAHAAYSYSTFVRFSYEERPDKREQLDRSVTNNLDARLKTITVEQFQRRVKEYRLHYHELAADRPSLLRAVEECVLETPDADEDEDLVCSQAMTFEYENESFLDEEFAEPIQLGFHPVNAIYLEDTNRYAWTPSEHILDFDGDGIDDIAMQVFNDDTGWKGRRWQFLRGGREAIDTAFEAPGEAYLYGHLSTVLDIDADGRDELLMEGLQDPDATYTYVDYDDGEFRLVDTEISATNYQFEDSFTYIVDVDGDGLKDIVRCDERDYETQRTWRIITTPSLSVSSVELETVGCFRQHAAIDVNMDGREELITTGDVRDDGELVGYGLVAISFDGLDDGDSEHATGSQAVLRINQSDLIANYIPFAGRDDEYLTTLDATGDGLADIVVFDGQKVHAYINQGARSDGTPYFEHEYRLNGEYGAARLPSGAGFKFGPVVDVNADGRQDIMVYSNSTEDPNWFALVATNGDLWDPTAFSGFTIVELPGIPAYGPSNRPITMDFDGDGVRDYVQKDTTGLGADYFMGYRKVAKVSPKLTRVTDSYGSVVEFTYESTSNPEVYASTDSRDEGHCTYPVLCRTPRGTVVHTERQVDTGGGAREFVHSYAGARYGLQGRSFLGFAVHEVLEADRQALTSTVFANSVQSRSGAYPYVGLPQTMTAEVRDGNRRFDRVVENIFALRYHEAREDDVFFPYVDATTDARREVVGGERVADLIFEQIDYSVDEYNNIKQVDTNWGQTPDAGDERLVTTFTYAYEEDDSFVDSWLIALPWERTDTSSGQPGSDTGSTARTVEYRHFDHGGVRQITIAPDNADLRSETHFTYDAFGNAEQVTEIAQAEGEQVTRTTTLEYDERGVFPESVTDAEGYLTEFEFDTILGLPTRVVFRGSGAEAIEQISLRDGFGRPRFSRAPSGVETRTSYAPLEAGGYRATQSVDGEGDVSVDYDSRGRPIQTRGTGFGGEELAQSTLYDTNGNVLEVTRPMVSGGATQRFRYAYDNLGRRTSVEHPDESMTEICREGRVTCVLDVNRHTRCSKTDARDRIVLVTEPVYVAGACQDYAFDVALSDDVPGMEYQYGPFDTVERIWDPAGNLTRITYDELGQVRTRQHPGTELNTTLFNGFGEIEVVRRGNSGDAIEATSRYDLLGRPTQLVTVDGTTQWQWDSDRPGIINSSTSPSGVVRSFDYDDQLLLERHSLRVAEDGETDDVIYHITDRDDYKRARIVTIESGGGGSLNLRYDYDEASGALRSVRDDDSGATYWRLVETDDFGAVHVEEMGPWTTELVHEPDTGLISAIRTLSDDDSIVLQDLGFDFDATGNLREKVDNTFDESTSYHYDEHDRLELISKTIDGVFFSEQYDYDEVGNLRVLPGVQSLEYDYGDKPHAVSRVVSSDGQLDYTYDDFGRLETRSGDLAPSITVDAYTAFDLPAAITLEEDELTREFKYDAAQNRVVSEDENSRTILGPSFYRTEAADGSNQVHNFIISNGERAVAQLIRRETAEGFEDRVVYLHRDHLGSIVAVTEGDEVVEDKSYAAFGAVTHHEEDPDGTLLSFTGHLEDMGGLVDMGGRIYDPLVGRFTTPDPIIADPTNSQDYNRYSYVRNNPTSLTDPTGLCTCDNLSPSCWCYDGGTQTSIDITQTYEGLGIAAPESAANAEQTWKALSTFPDGALNSGSLSVYVVAIPYEVINFAAASYSDAITQERFGPGLAYSSCVLNGICPALGDTLLASTRLNNLDYFRRFGAELIMGEAITLLDPNASAAAKSIAVVMIVATVATGGAAKVLKVAKVVRAARGGGASVELFHGTTSAGARSVLSEGLLPVSRNTAPFPAGSFFTHAGAEGQVAASHWAARSAGLYGGQPVLLRGTMSQELFNSLSSQGLIRTGPVPGLQFFPPQTVILPQGLGAASSGIQWSIVPLTF